MQLFLRPMNVVLFNLAVVDWFHHCLWSVFQHYCTLCGLVGLCCNSKAMMDFEAHLSLRSLQNFLTFLIPSSLHFLPCFWSQSVEGVAWKWSHSLGHSFYFDWRWPGSNLERLLLIGTNYLSYLIRRRKWLHFLATSSRLSYSWMQSSPFLSQHCGWRHYSFSSTNSLLWRSKLLTARRLWKSPHLHQLDFNLMSSKGPKMMQSYSKYSCSNISSVYLRNCILSWTFVSTFAI